MIKLIMSDDVVWINDCTISIFSDTRGICNITLLCCTVIWKKIAERYVPVFDIFFVTATSMSWMINHSFLAGNKETKLASVFVILRQIISILV